MVTVCSGWLQPMSRPNGRPERRGRGAIEGKEEERGAFE